MKASELVNKVKMSAQEHSPEILIAFGILGTVGSAILACKATLKAKEVVEEHKKELEEVHALEAEPEETVAKVYVRTGVQLVKLDGPSIALGALSIGCIVYSNDIMRKRNAAATAAYMLLDKSFKDYRSRVVDKFGKEVDYKLRHGIEEIEYKEKVVDENGKEKTQKRMVNVVKKGSESDYVKFFTKSNPNWSNDPSMNEYFFKIAQANMNDRLIAKGHLTLNEAYEILGFQDTKAGFVVGWRYDTKCPTGDNMVELDIKDICLADDNGNFEWGYAIDFNVDGNIYNYMT